MVNRCIGGISSGKVFNNNILMTTLTTFHELPSALLDCPARDLHRVLPGPTLIHLRGRIAQPLFVSVLLHGNETTGYDALRAVLTSYAVSGLPRALSIFIGNVQAAEHGVRTLPHQIDYNRVWPGTERMDCPEAALMRAVYDQVALRQPFASIDLHNNSGINPYYGCVASLASPFLYLARLFSRVVVFIERPLGVQSIAMGKLCPAVTVECGRIGNDEGVVHAAQFIDACLHLSHFPERPIAPQDVDLLHTVAVVKVPPALSISFDNSAADICFRHDLDRLNFSPIAAGTAIATTYANGAARLTVVSGDGAELNAPWFHYAGGQICFAQPVIPAMLTRDSAAVRADCLCYLMQPLSLSGSGAA